MYNTVYSTVQCNVSGKTPEVFFFISNLVKYGNHSLIWKGIEFPLNVTETIGKYQKCN